MSNKKNRTTSQIDIYAEDIFEQYSNSVGEFNVGKNEEKFIKNLVYNCEGVFSELDIFDVLKILRRKGLMKESILKNSFIKKASVMSNINMTETLKCEIEEFTYNSCIKHLNDNGDVLFVYETECFTLPSLEEKITIGDNFVNITYKNKGRGLVQDTIKNNKSIIDFKINNLIILNKKEKSKDEFKESVNIIIVPKLAVN